jgi:hypothetical protein
VCHAAEVARWRRGNRTSRAKEQAEIIPAPAKILYSLPTICDVLPPLRPGVSTAEADVFWMHEDDWRQVELVAVSHDAVISRNLSEIGAVRRAAGTGPGFGEIFVRSQPLAPLAGCVLTPHHLEQAVGPVRRHLDSAGFSEVTGKKGQRLEIESSFAFEVEGAIVYGIVAGGVVQAAGVAPSADQDHGRSLALAGLAGRLESLGVVLVDWPRALRYGGLA